MLGGQKHGHQEVVTNFLLQISMAFSPVSSGLGVAIISSWASSCRAAVAVPGMSTTPASLHGKLPMGSGFSIGLKLLLVLKRLEMSFRSKRDKL